MTVRVRNSIVDAAGDEAAADEIPFTLRPHTTAIARQRLFIADPALWSLDDPNLYTCTTTITAGGSSLDAGDTTFGVRRLPLDLRHGLRINGETVKFRRTCVHHDNGPIGAATIDRAEERPVELAEHVRSLDPTRYVTNTMARAWPIIMDSGHVIGDFTWTGWDYLGEVGIGHVEYAGDRDGDDDSPQLMAPYPWLLADGGDIDITGVRTSQSYFRRDRVRAADRPYIAGRRPANLGREVTHTGPWAWSDPIRRPGRGRGSRTRPCRSRCTPTPTRSRSS